VNLCQRPEFLRWSEGPRAWGERRLRPDRRRHVRGQRRGSRTRGNARDTGSSR